MYMLVVVAVVNLAGHMMTIETRMHPFPTLESCQQGLKDHLEAQAADKQYRRLVTKSECEKL